MADGRGVSREREYMEEVAVRGAMTKDGTEFVGSCDVVAEGMGWGEAFWRARFSWFANGHFERSDHGFRSRIWRQYCQKAAISDRRRRVGLP
jgi:hypothetical protein